MIDLDRLKLQALGVVCALLLMGCGVLAFGWWNAERDKDAMLGLFNRVATIIEEAEFVVDTLKAGLADENQRVFLEGPQAILDETR